MSGPTDLTPPTREALYERIRRSTRDAVIDAEMRRLGFWPRSVPKPTDPPDEAARRAELQQQLAALQVEAAHMRDHDRLVKEARKARLLASREKRKATLQRRADERRQRAAAWRERQARELTHLGVGVSAGLNSWEANAERLAKEGLPAFADAEALARAMGLTVRELRFLAFARRVGPVSHYVRFRIPKKAGGDRLISAPMPRLKAAQAWLLREVLDQVALHDAAHGFRPGRSIATNATPHVGAAIVVNMDLQDFFPSIGYPRVKGLFRALGYPEAVATIFALLATEPETEEVELDGQRLHVATGPRRLPQGAPCSPAITNILCRRLDRRLAGLAAAEGCAYTRYADDLTFSTLDAGAKIGRVLRAARGIVAHEGLTVHPQKTKVLRRYARQEVTGLVVNQRLSVPRTSLRNFRATLRQVELDGPAGKRWGRGPDVLQNMRGFAEFVRMVDKAKGEPLVARVAAVMARVGYQPPPRRAWAGKAVAAAPAAIPAADGNVERWWT